MKLLKENFYFFVKFRKFNETYVFAFYDWFCRIDDQKLKVADILENIKDKYGQN